MGHRERQATDHNVEALMMAMVEGAMQNGPKGFTTGELISAILTMLNATIKTVSKYPVENKDMLEEIATKMFSIMPATGTKQ